MLLAPVVPRLKKPRVDFDSPWKHALNFYFQDFMEFCFPAIAEKIDWWRGYETLDKELLMITKGVRGKRRSADKLIKVWEKSGQETWIICHVEVQGTKERGFPERMLVYRYRTRDYYQVPVLSIAILTDNQAQWRPAHYREDCYGSVLEIRYLVVKLIDYRPRRAELECLKNPFATVMLAQLVVLDHAKGSRSRLHAKTALTRQLYEKGWSKEEIIRLYTLVDWLIALPDALTVEYDEMLKQIEEEKQVEFMTRQFRSGLEQGIHQGEMKLFLRQLQQRFGALSSAYQPRVEAANDETLLLWAERVLDASTIEGNFFRGLNFIK